MKKLITSLVALAGISMASYAQTRDVVIDWSFFGPARGSALPCTESFPIAITLINEGPDAIQPGDTLYYMHPKEYVYDVMQAAVAPGDTIGTISYNMTAAEIEYYASGNSIYDKATRPISNNDSIGLPFGGRVTNTDIITTQSFYAVTVYYACGTTSINDFTKTQLGIFPNPAKNQITVNFDATATEGSIRVFDVMGRTIITQNVSKNTSAYTLDISSLNNGSYFVELVSGDVRGINKFVVSK